MAAPAIDEAKNVNPMTARRMLAESSVALEAVAMFMAALPQKDGVMFMAALPQKDGVLRGLDGSSSLVSTFK